jgi:hypothetical protein
LALRGAAVAVALLALILGILLSASPEGPVTPDGGTAVKAPAPAETVWTDAGDPAARSVFFGLPGAVLQDGGQDVLFETEIVPNPKGVDVPGEENFPLYEMKPVLDAEICADF